MATQQSRPRIGVLVLSPDFVKSFRLFHFRRKEMESQEVKYVGVDCGKKSIEVVRINSENSLERRQFSTTESGINNLLQWLTLNDIVGLEAGSQSFRIALRANSNASLLFGNLAHHESLDWISIF
ncbi:transposase domain protein [Leptospira interrogans serovar Pyrogenes str. L0374]|uniref:Transposase domain protein n=1 Tax=Leptospira interrogans serovar Pyrogenes str. L0374 TaxID=1049928 RepID=M6KAH3_LEPIR|nr:transposase domain protein [Leptospira interrogans serovar Pyrogenes str. L0374]